MLGEHAPLGYTAIYSTVMLSGLVGYILWDRRYRRKWRQARARNWPQTLAKFDEGEIVRMRKGRSKDIAGYQVWLGYEYDRGISHDGLYTLPYCGEFKTEEQAEECRKILAHAKVPVRVSPRNPKRSCVLDFDVARLLSTSDLRQ